MKITRVRMGSVVAMAVIAISMVAGGRFMLGQRGVQASSMAAMGAAGSMPLGLPTEANAKSVLSAALINHHPQWIDVPMGAVKIRSFVIYPDVAGKAPVVVVTAKNQGMSDWVRAVGTGVVNEGLIAVVPDLLSGMGPNGGGTDSFANRDAIANALSRMSPSEIQRRTTAVRDYFVKQSNSNGKSAILDFNLPDAVLNAAISTPSAQRAVKFEMTEHAWHSAMPLLMSLEEQAMPQQVEGGTMMSPEAYAAADENERKSQKAVAQRPDILPFMWNDQHVVETSPRKGKWVDIPIVSKREGPIKVRTWVVEPLGDEKAGVVVIIHPTPGMDLGEGPQKGGGANWMRGVADSVAYNGFIAVVPDMTSGLAPGGGNFDSFPFADDVIKAVGTRSPAERMQIVTAARDYALKLPRANGKSGAVGFCLGGSIAWQATADMPGLNAAVSFYGGPPDAATMARIQAPVYAFDGDADLGTWSRMVASAPDMKKLGKDFQYKVYAGATHSFLYQQQLNQNAAATLDSWPKAMAFFKKYLSSAS